MNNLFASPILKGAIAALEGLAPSNNCEDATGQSKSGGFQCVQGRGLSGAYRFAVSACIFLFSINYAMADENKRLGDNDRQSPMSAYPHNIFIEGSGSNTITVYVNGILFIEKMNFDRPFSFHTDLRFLKHGRPNRVTVHTKENSKITIKVRQAVSSDEARRHPVSSDGGILCAPPPGVTHCEFMASPAYHLREWEQAEAPDHPCLDKQFLSEIFLSGLTKDQKKWFVSYFRIVAATGFFIRENLPRNCPDDLQGMAFSHEAIFYAAHSPQEGLHTPLPEGHRVRVLIRDGLHYPYEETDGDADDKVAALMLFETPDATRAYPIYDPGDALRLYGHSK